MKSDLLVRAIALAALTGLVACDRQNRADLQSERMSLDYQAAMDDYRSGRLDVAIAGFEKVVRADPANSSARFQLACLQHDLKQNYLEAYCGYREYLMQKPDSDKAGMTRDRLAICEKELAKKLAVKHGLLNDDGLAKELESVRKALKLADDRAAAAEKDLERARGRISALSSERDRLIAAVKGESEVVDASKPSVPEVKALLEEEDEDEDRIKVSADVAALKLEEASEVASSSSMLPVQNVAPKKTSEPQPEVAQKDVPQRPKTYVVQEGDTLYALAKRFYGRLSAWRMIRDANKALISMDNRLRVGDTLRLP